MREVWCPSCYRMVDAGSDAEVTVHLQPQVVTIGTDGSVDLGMRDDAFLDYWHMECGTKVRICTNARWDGERYAPDPNPMIEVYTAEEPDRGIVPLDYGVESDPDRWRPSLETMLALLDEARAAAQGGPAQ